MPRQEEYLGHAQPGRSYSEQAEARLEREGEERAESEPTGPTDASPGGFSKINTLVRNTMVVAASLGRGSPGDLSRPSARSLDEPGAIGTNRIENLRAVFNLPPEEACPLFRDVTSLDKGVGDKCSFHWNRPPGRVPGGGLASLLLGLSVWVGRKMSCAAVKLVCCVLFVGEGGRCLS
jgi:hypothetical protein